MTAEIIDGKAFAEKIRNQVKEQTSQFKEKTGITPGLTVVLVGEDPASEVYVRNKGIQAEAVGFNSNTIKLDKDITQDILLDIIHDLNVDNRVHGMLVQLPLPAHLDEKAIIHAINPQKDVDGFHPENIGKLWLGETCPIPCTPLGCSLILEDIFGDTLAGKNVLMIGASNIVGKPMTALLLKKEATVTVAHSLSKNIPDLSRQADILIVATGNAHLVKGDWIKPGATILDVGINRIKDGERSKIVGDVDFAEAKEKAAFITPVPGGIGPMTIACLLWNTLQQAQYIESNK